jgi:hypothetical protein
MGVYTNAIDKIYTRIVRQNAEGGILDGSIDNIFKGFRKHAMRNDEYPAIVIDFESLSENETRVKKRGTNLVAGDSEISMYVDLYFFNTDIDKTESTDTVSGIVELLEKIHDSIYADSDGSPSPNLNLNGLNEVHITGTDNITVDNEGVRIIRTNLTVTCQTYTINNRRLSE